MELELVILLCISNFNPCDLLAEWRKSPWIFATFLSTGLTVKAIKKRGKVRESERGWKYGTGEREERATRKEGPLC